MRRTTNQDSPALIARRVEFKGSNLTGESHTPGNYASKGHCPEWAARSLNDADFIVYSYWTPIAWHVADGWVIPPVSYSISTAKHQSYAHRAASGNYSARHIRHGWELGLTATQSKALDSLRHGYALAIGDYSRRTLQAIVDAGLAQWTTPDVGAIVSTEQL